MLNTLKGIFAKIDDFFERTKVYQAQIEKDACTVYDKETRYLLEQTHHALGDVIKTITVMPRVPYTLSLSQLEAKTLLRTIEQANRWLAHNQSPSRGVDVKVNSWISDRILNLVNAELKEYKDHVSERRLCGLTFPEWLEVKYNKGDLEK